MGTRPHVKHSMTLAPGSLPADTNTFKGDSAYTVETSYSEQFSLSRSAKMVPMFHTKIIGLINCLSLYLSSITSKSRFGPSELVFLKEILYICSFLERSSDSFLLALLCIAKGKVKEKKMYKMYVYAFILSFEITDVSEALSQSHVSNAAMRAFLEEKILRNRIPCKSNPVLSEGSRTF